MCYLINSENPLKSVQIRLFRSKKAIDLRFVVLEYLEVLTFNRRSPNGCRSRSGRSRVGVTALAFAFAVTVTVSAAAIDPGVALGGGGGISIKLRCCASVSNQWFKKTRFF